MRKTKERSWIGNSGLGLLDCQKTKFTGLEPHIRNVNYFPDRFYFFREWCIATL